LYVSTSFRLTTVVARVNHQHRNKWSFKYLTRLWCGLSMDCLKRQSHRSQAYVLLEWVHHLLLSRLAQASLHTGYSSTHNK
jgi:hypothetical protein